MFRHLDCRVLGRNEKKTVFKMILAVWATAGTIQLPVVMHKTQVCLYRGCMTVPSAFQSSFFLAVDGLLPVELVLEEARREMVLHCKRAGMARTSLLLA